MEPHAESRSNKRVDRQGAAAFLPPWPRRGHNYCHPLTSENRLPPRVTQCGPFWATAAGMPPLLDRSVRRSQSSAVTRFRCLSIIVPSCVLPCFVNAVVPLIVELDFETNAGGVGRLGTADRENAVKRTGIVTSPVRSGTGELEAGFSERAFRPMGAPDKENKRSAVGPLYPSVG